MENEFLHRINVEALKKELKMDIPSIAKLAGISENGVYKWAWAKESHGARPPFNAIIKLLQAGASTETLFGVSSKPQQPAAGQPSPEFLNAHPELMEGIQEQLMADIMAGLKEKGIFSEEKIRDIARQEIERLLPSAKPINKF